MSSRSQERPHALALGAGFHHAGGYLANTLGELLLRALCSAPLIYAAATGSFFGVPKAHAIGVAILCCLPLWILFVLPLRYRLGGRLSDWVQGRGPHPALNNYPRWLSQTLVRLVRVLPFLLPLLAWLGAYYYYIKIIDFPSFFEMLRSAGGLIGGDFLHGMALLGLVFLLCLGLAIWGWRRVMVFYYLPLAPVSQDAERRKALKGRGLGLVSLINFLILLPALVLLLSNSLFADLTGSLERAGLTFLGHLTQFSFDSFNLREIAIWLAVLYLPFVLWRKAAIAAAIHRGGPRA